MVLGWSGRDSLRRWRLGRDLAQRGLACSTCSINVSCYYNSYCGIKLGEAPAPEPQVECL